MTRKTVAKGKRRHGAEGKMQDTVAPKAGARFQSIFNQLDNVLRQEAGWLRNNKPRGVMSAHR
ncbi:MAG: hypothetical protein APF80_12425 [Alphaproteobacteria bacterium BRH_c36]|nr:MAG: hypothetical protein APF80_12425 [Alphaproteobacteria bacterium BRH_c36]